MQLSVRSICVRTSRLFVTSGTIGFTSFIGYKFLLQRETFNFLLIHINFSSLNFQFYIPSFIANPSEIKDFPKSFFE